MATDDPFWRVRRPTTPCAVDGCGASARIKGWCQKHYARWKRNGTPLKACPSGPKPVGTKTFQTNGYVLVKVGGDHPYMEHNGWTAEHRLVMMETLGRHLAPGENVHHLSGKRDDNRPENLELWAVPQPPGQRVGDLTRANALQ